MIKREWQNRQPDCMMTVGDDPCDWQKAGTWTNPKTQEIFQTWFCLYCKFHRHELINSTKTTITTGQEL